MRKISPLSYVFAIGKIRALERFLIRKEVFGEAIASGLDEALRLFSEADLYGDEILEIKNSRQLEMVLNQGLLRLKNLMRNLLLDKGFLCFIELDNLSKMQAVCKNTGSEFLDNYLMHLTDMQNIKTFLRLYFLKEPPEKLPLYITSEGFMKKEVFQQCFEQDLSLFLNRLEYVHRQGRLINYADFLAQPILEVKEKNSFVALEKAINDFLMQVLKPAKYLSFGPEPLLAYYFAKLNEISLIRMIILAKLNQIEAPVVQESLNIVYA